MEKLKNESFLGNLEVISPLNQKINIEPVKNGFNIVLNNASYMMTRDGSDVFKTKEEVIDFLNWKYEIVLPLESNSTTVANLIRSAMQYGISGKIRLDPSHEGFYRKDNHFFCVERDRRGYQITMENPEQISSIGAVKSFGFRNQTEYGILPYVIVGEIPKNLIKISLSEMIEEAIKMKKQSDSSAFALTMCESMGWDY